MLAASVTITVNTETNSGIVLVVFAFLGVLYLGSLAVLIASK